MATKGQRRQNKKHFILYNNNGVISATTPKDWARGHKEAFPNHAFLDSAHTPTDTQIENYIVRQLGYHQIQNNEIIISYPYLDL